MMFHRRFLWLVPLIGVFGLSTVSEARAAPSSTASKSFHALLTTKAAASSVPPRQTILAELRNNYFALLQNLTTLRNEFRFRQITYREFLYNRQVSLAVYRAEQSFLLFELRFGRPPLTPGF